MARISREYVWKSALSILLLGLMFLLVAPVANPGKGHAEDTPPQNFNVTLLTGTNRTNGLESSMIPTSVICTPTGAATFSNRIHIRCAQSFSGVVFFAYRSSDSAGAARYMSMATSALISGRNVRIFYDPADLSGTNIGCLTSDCRLLQGLEIL